MDNENTPTGGLAVHVIIGLIATGLLIIAMLLYFVFWNVPNTSSITIQNNGQQIINIQVSSPNKDDSSTLKTTPPKRINPNGNITFTAYPGTTLIIKGYTDGNQTSLTYAKLILGNSGTSSAGKFTFDGITYDNLFASNNSSDSYGVSLQEGYNLPITIFPNNSNIPDTRDSSNIFSCSGPIWYQYINSTNSVFPCPASLESNSNCVNPCTKIGGDYCDCENQWDQLDYYYTFASACPNCLITTCDDLNYYCTRNDINNHNPINYSVIFYPDVGVIGI